jgi:hypothetical protein
MPLINDRMNPDYFMNIVDSVNTTFSSPSNTDLSAQIWNITSKGEVFINFT